MDPNKEQETLFIAVIAALIPVIVAFSFIVFLFYRQRREAHFRQEKLQYQLDKSEMEMRALRAQVNPHFVFNCLNSILQYVQQNETELASSYLVRFSRLIRLVLENSTYSMAPLEDDLKALELYLEMEKLRLNHSFEYHIKLDNIEAHTISVPPLLIQPFVENSIWHGLANHGSGGKIDIQLCMENERLFCSIEDNGADKKPNTDRGFKTKSMGLELISRRLDLYENLHKERYTFSIESLSQGTRVKLELPYE